jgi:hypothetical protein
MSRGPGKWQRAILDEIQRREVFYVRELLPSPQTRSDQLAVLRAAHRLAQAGKITINAGHWGWSTRARWTGERLESLGAVIVARPGVVIDRTELRLTYALAAWHDWLRWRDVHQSEQVSDNNTDIDNNYGQALAEQRITIAAVRVAREFSERQCIEVEWLRVEQERARAALARKEAEVMTALDEKLRREFEQLGESLRAQHVEAFTPTRHQIGMTATTLKVRLHHGEPCGDAEVIAALVSIGWEAGIAQQCLDQLRANGTYQRIIDEAAQARQS